MTGTSRAASEEVIGSPPQFKPYVLWRHAMLPFTELLPMVPEATWALLDSHESGRRERRELANQLADRLYALVPTVGADTRRCVLQVRRDLHNDRLPRPDAIASVKRLLDVADAVAFNRWLQSHAAEQQLFIAAAQQLAADLEAARLHLAVVASGENFLRGIQLSGNQLYRNVRAYIARVRQSTMLAPSKQIRQTESTILRYAYRMALRPSPFGSFTEIGAQPWRPVGEPGEFTCKRRHLVRLNRGMLTWMVHGLRNVEGCRSHLLLRLNNTLRSCNDQLEAFVRGMDGSAYGYWGERHVKIRGIGALAVVLDALRDGPVPRLEVLRRLVDRGAATDRASNFIDTMVEAGVCHEDIALSDQTPSFALAVATWLGCIPTQQASECAKVFGSLQRVEDDFGAANVDQREHLLERIAEQIDRFIEISGVPQATAMMRSFVFEDVAAQRGPQSWCPDLLESNLQQFLWLQRLLPVFDDTSVQKLGLYRWFVSRFGERGRCDDLLELYQEFAKQSPGEIADIMQGTHDPHAEQIRALRSELLCRLEKMIAHCAETPVVRLEKCFDDHLPVSLPAFLPPWIEASYRLQLLPARCEGSPLIVLNEVTTGHGIFFSRFCDLLDPAEPGQWSLRRVLTDTIAQSIPRQADLTAVFGLNINLHPRVTPLEVVYPGSIAVSAEGVLTLRDLAVEADPMSHTLRLRNGRDGRALELTPMNFLFPAAAPMLYRFLCALSPVHGYSVRLWDQLREVGRSYPSLPRLMLGDIVLERRRWYVPAAEISELDENCTPDSIAGLLRTQRWHQRRGLPRECFFRVHEQIRPRERAANWVDETRRWAIEARSTRRKRQYLDFRSPFMVRLLMRQARRAGNGVVEFQECLPPTAVYNREGSPDSAEEFLVELRAAPERG